MVLEPRKTNRIRRAENTYQARVWIMIGVALGLIAMIIWSALSNTST